MVPSLNDSHEGAVKRWQDVILEVGGETIWIGEPTFVVMQDIVRDIDRRHVWPERT